MQTTNDKELAPAVAQPPFSPCDAAGNPICEECDVSMHEFACIASTPPVSGWACPECAWSFDT
jgi:hypothetical protein